MNTMNVLSAALSGLGALVAAGAFVKLLGSKRERESVLLEARAAERAKIAARRAAHDRKDLAEDELLVASGR